MALLFTCLISDLLTNVFYRSPLEDSISKFQIVKPELSKEVRKTPAQFQKFKELGPSACSTCFKQRDFPAQRWYDVREKYPTSTPSNFNFRPDTHNEFVDTCGQLPLVPKSETRVDMINKYLTSQMIYSLARKYSRSKLLPSSSDLRRRRCLVAPFLDHRCRENSFPQFPRTIPFLRGQANSSGFLYSFDCKTNAEVKPVPSS